MEWKEPSCPSPAPGAAEPLPPQSDGRGSRDIKVVVTGFRASRGNTEVRGHSDPSAGRPVQLDLGRGLGGLAVPARAVPRPAVAGRRDDPRVDHRSGPVVGLPAAEDRTTSADRVEDRAGTGAPGACLPPDRAGCRRTADGPARHRCAEPAAVRVPGSPVPDRASTAGAPRYPRRHGPRSASQLPSRRAVHRPADRRRDDHRGQHGQPVRARARVAPHDPRGRSRRPLERRPRRFRGGRGLRAREYWQPESPTVDRYKAYGFPVVPGLLAAATRPFASPGSTCRGC